MSRSFIIVGAGLGGLATALRLSHLGHKVTVLEKTDAIGGRCRGITVGQCQFDMGPTLMMMMDPFRKVFTDVGERMEDHLEVELCDPSYRVFYADRTRFEGTTNVPVMQDRIRAMAGDLEADRYPKLLEDLKVLYDEAIPNFVRQNYLHPGDVLTPEKLGIVLRRRMLGNLAKRIESYVADPKLRMLFSFQTMYLGLSPFDAPWVYAVLTYMEYGEGIFYPKGGLNAIPKAIAKLAVSRGAEIKLNTPVAAIEGRRVILESGEWMEADAIICNADLPYAETQLQQLPAKNRANSCSAYMMYLDYDGELLDLLHHNVFFGDDFKGNLDAIFHEPLHVPDSMSFYACISRRSDPELAPSGRENLYVLVPCPNLDLAMTPADEKRIQDHVFRRLTEESGFDPKRVRASHTFGAETWRDLLNLDRGAAFGLSHIFSQSAFFRPSNRSSVNPNLYFVGASTVPGNGLPMVLISAELIEDRFRRTGLI